VGCSEIIESAFRKIVTSHTPLQIAQRRLQNYQRINPMESSKIWKFKCNSQGGDKESWRFAEVGKLRELRRRRKKEKDSRMYRWIIGVGRPKVEKESKTKLVSNVDRNCNLQDIN
jgi:hypothetical protein